MKSQEHILTLVNEIIIKILNLNLLVLLECKNTKNIFANVYTPNWSEKVFMI